jgi:hypothetical protein
MAYTLKNANIAKANPNSTANSSYINALYKEVYNRDATKAELNRFAGKTVKDSANIILGVQKSPFYGTSQNSGSNDIKNRIEKIKSPTPSQSSDSSTWSIANSSAKATPSQSSDSSTWNIARSNIKSNVYDPLAEAAKYGYTAADFAGNANFVSDWSKKTPAELRIALSNRGDFDKSKGIKKIAGTVATENALKRYKDAGVANGSITAEDAAAIGQIFDEADTKTGTSMTSEEIEAKLNDIKAAVVIDQNKYYTERTNRALSDLKTSYDDIRNESLRYQQKEQKSYNELLADAKKSVRAKGMTFSGTSVKRLGAESAQANPTNIEGEIPQDRRYGWEDASAGFQQASRNAGMAAERSLGSGTLDSSKNYLKPTGLPDPYGRGVTYRTGATRDIYIPHQSDQTDYVKYGDLELEKLRTIEEETQARMKKINPLK